MPYKKQKESNQRSMVQQRAPVRGVRKAEHDSKWTAKHKKQRECQFGNSPTEAEQLCAEVRDRVHEAQGLLARCAATAGRVICFATSTLTAAKSAWNSLRHWVSSILS
jgi:hypothetical protein